MSTITWPVSLVPKTASLRLQTVQRVHASPFGGSEQTVDLLNDRWLLSLTLSARAGFDKGAQIEAFIAALPSLGAQDRIPRFEDINTRLKKTTGWEIVGVPGLIPEVPFFTLLANRKFPVTDWIRTPEEFDYIVEPDIFHDLFGHVPLLFNPVFADYVQRYGQGGLKAHGLGACEMLSRLYWYTIEFGLIREAGGLRAYGAGILSSAGELPYAVQSPEPQRLPLQLERTMRTRYKIDTYQQTYFVIDSFEQLFDMTAPDFGPVYQQLQGLPALEADELQPQETGMYASSD